MESCTCRRRRCGIPPLPHLGGWCGASFSLTNCTFVLHTFQSELSFWNELDIFLLRHFTPSDAKLVLQKFKQVSDAQD